MILSIGAQKWKALSIRLIPNKPVGSQQKATKKALRTRRQILESSVALFRERGFDATSMRDIASRAGLSLGSTYYYFESKQALVFDYYVESQEEASQHNDATIAASTSFDARLRDRLECKLEAVRPVVEHGRPVSEVADSLGVNRNMLSSWKTKFEAEGTLAFPGHGKLSEIEEENRRLRRELSTSRLDR